MASNPNFKFEADLAKWAVALDMSLSKAAQQITMRIFRDIVNLSPVDTGSYRASHQIAFNTPSDEVVNMGGESKSNKRASRTKALEQLRKLKILGVIKTADIIWISNNQPYAEKIEFGGYNDGPKVKGGYPSQMQAKGVYKIALQNAERSVQAILDQVDLII